MRNLGVLLIVLGLGSFILPLIGFQFTLMSWVDLYQPWAGIGVAIGGVALVLLARSRSGAASPPTPPPGPPGTPSDTSSAGG